MRTIRKKIFIFIILIFSVIIFICHKNNNYNYRCYIKSADDLFNNIDDLSYECAKKTTKILRLSNNLLFENGYPSLVDISDSKLYDDLLMIIDTGNHQYFNKDPYILKKINFSIEHNTYDSKKLMSIYDFIITSNEKFKNTKPFSELKYLSYFQIWENEKQRKKYIDNCAGKICDVNNIEVCDYNDVFSLKKFFISSKNFYDFLSICKLQNIVKKPRTTNDILMYISIINKLRRIGILDSSCYLEETFNSENYDKLNDVTFMAKIRCQ